MAISVDDATALVTRIFNGHGVSAEPARCVARVLVDSEASGVRTHGLARVPEYLTQLRDGVVNPRPNIEVDETPGSSIVRVDGDNGPGAATANVLLERALDIASRTGVAIGTARRGHHLGALGYYVREAAERGYLAFLTQSTFATMAPWGGAEATLGNNPFAIALPRGGEHGLLLDMACSVAARGHISMAARRGEDIPEDWALDRDGRPTTDPALALDGILRPFGGHKGSGLAVVLGALSGVLSGGAFGTSIERPGESERPRDVGYFLLVVDVGQILPRADYDARIDQYVAELIATRPLDAQEPVRAPGQRQADRRDNSFHYGIDVDPDLWKELITIENEMGTTEHAQ